MRTRSTCSRESSCSGSGRRESACRRRRGRPGPVLHRHTRMVDSFYVLEGTLTVRVEDEEHGLGPGSYAFVPPGVAHTFSNPSDETVRMLNLQAPGGLEQYLKELGSALKPGEQADPAVMATLASRYDFASV